MGDGGLGNGEVWEERESGWGSWGRQEERGERRKEEKKENK